MSKILTICIPTYNRSEYLKKQLLFLENEVKKNKDILSKIEFIISDNASTDNTKLVIDELQKNGVLHFNYVRNTSNLGLIKNLISLFNIATTEYIWFLSDDDTLYEGILEKIIEIIETNTRVEYVFLNFRNHKSKAYTGKTGYREDAKNAALEVFNETSGALIFISSCIYKHDNLKYLEGSKLFNKICAPLLFSFFSCSQGPIYITEKMWVEFTPGNASYNNISKLLRIRFEEYISILKEIRNFGYEKEDVNKAITGYLENYSHFHVLYNFYDFFKSIKLYKYYSLKAFLRIPINTISYLQKRLKF